MPQDRRSWRSPGRSAPVRLSVVSMTDAARRAEEAAKAVYDEQESNARTTGDGGPREEANADEFAELAEEESLEAEAEED